MKFNGTTIALKYYGAAHTDGDISAYFTDADVFHVGDTFWNGYYPFIDYSTGGSIDGMIRATEANLAKVTNKMVVIPGHGAVGDKSQLAFYRDLLVGTREKVASLSRSKANRSPKLSPQNLLQLQTQSGATDLGNQEILSETFSRLSELATSESRHFKKSFAMFMRALWGRCCPLESMLTFNA